MTDPVLDHGAAIGLKLAPTPGAVSGRASQKGISLKPTDQSPYNRRKKPWP
jgi:hypothetical protein